VNPVTNKMYVTNPNSNNVTVIDGATNTTATVATGTTPVAASVNTITNKIYISNAGSSNVTVIDGATNATTTVATGANPDSLAVNPITNKIYVSNQVSGTVTVIDGATNATTTITVGANPLPAVVNPVTNKVYVANNHGGTVTVIDGATNATTTVTVGTGPDGLALNPVTNKIYVPNFNTNNVTVIDGATNATTTVAVGTNPFGVALNSVTNQIYIANSGSSNVTVIDGATNSTTTVAAGTDPMGVAVNPMTNTVFVTNTNSNNITVINGATNSATTMTVGAAPDGVAVNPVTNKIYVGNTNDNTVTVIDGATNGTSTVTAGSSPFAAAVNPVTNQIYVANGNSDTVTVIDGVTNATVTVNVGTTPDAVAVNLVTNKIYVANAGNATITVIDGATNATTTVAVGSGTIANGTNGYAVAVNPVTNEIYVANQVSNTVSVIDGTTNTVTNTITVGTGPYAVAVNPVTNKIYVANFSSDTVTVIDGATNATTAVTVGSDPRAVAVNPVTNQIYVANDVGNGTVTVIDGATNSTTTLPVSPSPAGVAVNPVTNKIYVTSSPVTVIDGATNITSTVAAGSDPIFVAVNSVTNKIYVANFGVGSTALTVIDGATNTPSTVTVGEQPIAIAVNPVTNKIYVASVDGNNVTVINEQEAQAIPLTTTITPLADNQTSNPTPTFTFTASSSFAPTAPPVDALYFQFDTWQGPWIPATATPGAGFSGTAPTLSLGTHILYAFATDGQDATSIMTTIFGGCSPVTGAISAYQFVVNNSAGPATHFTVSAPATATAGTSFSVTVTALDASNATATGYTGTVHFTSSDGAAVLPADSTLTNGMGAFSATLETSGGQTITATDTVTASITGTSTSVTVSGAPTVTLTVQVTAGTGSVSSSPAGITACATTCSANFTGNSSVTLTAAPGTNFTFAGFTNCASTGALTCSVTMSAAETVTAAFTSSGGGGGGLTISPTTLLNGAVGAPYGQTLAVSGGTAPYNFTISAGALPAGLTLGATTGTIAGVPAGPTGPAAFTVHATDSSATPLTGSAAFNVTISAADSSNNSELNGSYAFLFQGFNDSDGTMVVVAGSFLTDGHGNISSGGFVDTDGVGSTGAQPPQEIASGSYTIGADNRGSMSLTTLSGTTVFAISVGDIQAGVATKARFIRFDDVSGTNGQTGSGVILKQDPSIFSLNALHGSYAFGETGTDLTNGDPESGVGFVNADGNGNFTTGGLIDLNDGGELVPSAAISGTYQLTDETVSSGRLSASVTIAGVNGTTSDVIYIVSSSQVLFISINTTQNSIFSGMAQLQVPPTGGFDLSSLINNSVVAVQGRQADGSPIVLIGSLATDGNGIFTLSYVQNNSDTKVSATAGGTYAVDPNGRAKLTYTSGGFSPTIIYLDGLNQGFAGATDANASSGPLDPGVSTYNNATLSTSDNFFFGTISPTSIKNINQSGVSSFGATTVQSVSDATTPGGILTGDGVGAPITYTVGPNGQLTFTTNNQGVVGYVASGCEIQAIFQNNGIPVIGTFECQVTPATLTVTEAGTGTGTVSSNPAGITCPATTCSASFESGSQVVLTATPTGGSTFGSFTTNCTPANPQTNPPSCTVAMSGSPTVIVTFTAGSGIPPALAITKSHAGNFTQGQQNATYTVTVSNGANAGPTSGTMTVADTIPAGLTLVSMAGTGWACAANTCTNSTVLGAGASSTITVTVNVASNAAASVTNAVSVSGGGSTAANTIDPTTITSSGGGGGSGIATVNPNPLAFGGVQVSVSSALSFTLQNTGTGPLGSIAFSVTNPDYTITTNTCATTLAAGSAACTITVTFTPSFQAPDTGAVVITDDSSAGPTTELLSGVGVGPIYVLPFEMFYDGITPGTTSPAQTATLFNTTDTVLSVTGVTFVGNAASDFSVTSNGCGDGADPSCPIGVAFTPSTTVLGPRTADLTIATNSETTPSVVSHLTGNGAIQHLPGFTANSFPPNDDDSTSAVNLPFSMNFFGTTYNQLYVNNNGNVTFGEPFGTYTPFGLTGNIGVPIIAPFFADVYTLTPGSDVVHYGVDTVNGQQAFGVNWENVAYYAEPDGEDCPPAILLNSFQLIVIARPDTGAGNFDMEFNYDKIQWETGTASGGVCGLGGSSAAVGYSNGTGDAGTNFQLPGSLVNGALLDVPTAAGFPGLIHSDLSSTMLGRYEFQVRNGAVQSADLGLTMTQSANPVPAGSNQTYTLTVTNAGPSDATNTTVSDTLPTNATLVSATPSQGAACTGTVTLTCNLGTVANAGTATVTIVVTVNAGATGTVVNNASVTSDLPDPNPGNNTASASATIGASTNVLLTIIPGGNGAGTVRSVPTGINCGATCSVNFPSGTTVVLTATPSDGSTFTGWGAGPCEGTGTCTITLTSPPTTVSVVANFAQGTNNFTLAVNEAGTGTGTVTSSPAGIVCPPAATCSASFASGQVVTLTATPANGSTFAGWSGVAGCPGTGTCTVTVSAAVTVAATFNSSSPVIITVAPGSPSTVVTSPGSSAVFGLTLTGTAGTTGTVQLGCTSPSLDITCNIVPSSIVLTGAAINVAIVVQTFCKGAVPGFRPLPGGFAGGLAMLLATMSLCGAMWTIKRRPRLALSFGVLILIAVGMSACSSLPKSPGGQATPPGSYPLVVTATAPNGAKSSVNLTLKVQ
jgi:YVTN family beta-propeller protein